MDRTDSQGIGCLLFLFLDSIGGIIRYVRQSEVLTVVKRIAGCDQSMFIAGQHLE